MCNLYAGLSKIEPHRGSSAEVETKTWQNYLPSAIARSSRQLLELWRVYAFSGGRCGLHIYMHGRLTGGPVGFQSLICKPRIFSWKVGTAANMSGRNLIWITDCLAPRPWHLCSSTSEWSCACFSKTRRGSICSLTLFATVSATFCHRPKQGILVCLHSSFMGVKSEGLTPLRGNMVTSSNQVIQVKGQLEWRFWKVGLCPSLLLHASVGVEMHQHVASNCASPVWLTFSVRIPSKKQLSSLMTDPSRGLRCKFACNCTKAYHIGSRSQVWANCLSQKLSSTYSCLFWCIWVVPKQLCEANA